MKCTECPEYRECVKHSNLAIKRKSCPKAKVEKQLTNADRIRSMSDEELAKFIPDWSYTGACKCGEQIYTDCNNECEKCVIEWLQQPAEVE